LVLVLASFQCGYHIGELNTPKDAITNCPPGTEPPPTLHELSARAIVSYIRWVPGHCVPMSDTEYSFVTAALTLGGLTGSFVAGHWASRWTRQKALRWGLICLAIGAIWTSLSDGPGGMAFGRWLSGFGTAVVSVVVPLWLTEIAPADQRGMIGVMHQLGTVVGILVAQLLGLFLSRPFVWRYILVVPGILAIAQTFMMSWCPETRPQLDEHEEESDWRQAGRSARRGSPHRRRRADAPTDADVDTDVAVAGPLPRTPRTPRHPHQRPMPSLAASTLLRRPYLRPTIAVLLCLFGQQVSGINAVMYYSTPILSSVMPSQAALVTVYISIANLLVTLLAARLADNTGKRKLLVVSTFGMSLSSLLLAFSITHGWGILSAALIILLVVTFGIGLGPVPFLVAADLFPPELTGLAQSVGLAANWIGNLIVAVFFLSIRERLGGWTFALFAGIL
ncbi:general substrate transporter, partial [Thamnocephalis sphaerospora]